jgi:phage terminase large subunit
MMALSCPNYKYLLLRRTMPELKRSHLGFLDYEMTQLGGSFLHTDSVTRYSNGSTGWFGHCESDLDILKYLSSEYPLVIFDEATTFGGEMFLKLAASCRAPLDSGWLAQVRGGTNPLGVGSDFIKRYFIEKTVDPVDDPDYVASDYATIDTTLSDNPHIDAEQYRRRLSSLPEHVRRAWLGGEWVSEGAYFSDFHPTKEEKGVHKPWHVINTLPTWQGQSLFSLSWLGVYRAIDWGYYPDPAVCLWIIALPNRRSIVFKERTWKRTLAADVAKQIKRESEGLHVIESFCDPTMLIKEGQSYSIGEIFEQNGVPVTPATNDRVLYGYSIHEQLNTMIDETPQLQIVRPVGQFGCPELLRTLPQLQMDPSDPRKLGNGNDHYAVALAYYCMGQAVPSQDPKRPSLPKWMRPKQRARV